MLGKLIWNSKSFRLLEIPIDKPDVKALLFASYKSSRADFAQLPNTPVPEYGGKSHARYITCFSTLAMNRILLRLWSGQ